MKKLHLGCGDRILSGWDNLDLHGNNVIQCDLRRPLPYATNSVSHVFSEHVIEHLDEVDGFNMLKEAYRVLIPGGHIRISCPDLAQYVDAYLNWNQASKSSDGNQFTSGVNYLNYATLGEAMAGLRYLSPVGQSTNHGHKYYYDENELRRKLETAGFQNIRRCKIRESDIPELKGLEWRPIMKDIAMEATK